MFGATGRVSLSTNRKRGRGLRPREKLTLKEKVALALDLIKHDRSIEEIEEQYQVSHTTAYKLRNAFLDGGRRARRELNGRRNGNIEERVRALGELVACQPRVPGVILVERRPRIKRQPSRQPHGEVSIRPSS